FNALGSIFEAGTGKSIFEEFDRRIGQKIGLEDFDWEKDGRYDYSRVSDHPAYHFDMSCRDMARIGLLVLNQGNWDGQEIVPADWIAESTAPQIQVGEDFGNGSYGYMWWIMDNPEFAEAGLSPLSFSAQGNWSQLIIIDPVSKIVIVHRGFKENLEPQAFIRLIRKIISAKA
ncbi:MAG: serine hydrolase domain-containing protein, partial [Bacteroidota bacterium]